MAKVLNHEIAEKYFSDDQKKRDLVYVDEYNMFYQWEDGWYKPIKDEDFAKDLWEFLRFSFSNVNITTSLVKDIMQQVRWGCLRRSKTLDTSLVSFKDKLLNLQTFEVENKNRDKIVPYHFPFFYDEIDMETPIFDNFLKTSLVKEKNTEETDYELIDLMQDLLGYFLLDNMKGSSAFFFVGEGANGKSVMADAILNMFGQEFSSAMSIQSLTTNKFKTTNLIGKKINISNEEESKFMRSDLFKALVTGETIDAEWKFGGSFEFRPKTKYLFCSNELPTFKGMNYGLLRRIKIIPFYKTFLPHEMDNNLSVKLQKEIPGIIKFAIGGAKRLMEKNYVFSTSKSSFKEHEKFKDELSSSIRFARYEYHTDDEYWVTKDELYSKYRDWCVESGKKMLNKFQFNKDILSHISGIDEKIKRIGGKSKRCFNLKPNDCDAQQMDMSQLQDLITK